MLGPGVPESPLASFPILASSVNLTRSLRGEAAGSPREQRSPFRVPAGHGGPWVGRSVAWKDSREKEPLSLSWSLFFFCLF